VVNRETALLELLLDRSQSIAARDDAAMDLAEFDSDATLQGLISAASNESEEAIILASCGESIAQIMIRRARIETRP
jgi:hypothetical protein